MQIIPKGQFAWNVKTCFLGKIRKKYHQFVIWICPQNGKDQGILKYFSYFSQKTGFWYFMQIVMNCQNLLSWKNKKNITYLSYAEFAHWVVKVKAYLTSVEST